jgi:hypothetical protein
LSAALGATVVEACFDFDAENTECWWKPPQDAAAGRHLLLGLSVSSLLGGREEAKAWSESMLTESSGGQWGMDGRTCSPALHHAWIVWLAAVLLSRKHRDALLLTSRKAGVSVFHQHLLDNGQVGENTMARTCPLGALLVLKPHGLKTHHRLLLTTTQQRNAMTLAPNLAIVVCRRPVCRAEPDCTLLASGSV